MVVEPPPADETSSTIWIGRVECADVRRLRASNVWKREWQEGSD